MPKLTRKAKARRKLILKWRRFLGLCIGCGAEAWGNALCDRCQDRQNKAMAKRREKNKVNSLCQECGKNRVNSGGYRCDRCMVLMRARYDRKCHTEGCDNDIVYHSRYCQECLDKNEAKKQSCKVYFIKCSGCGKLFVTKISYKKYCSDDCERESQLVRPIKRICAVCGKPYRVRRGRNFDKTCSVKCRKILIADVQRNARHRRRIRKLDAFVEHVSIIKLYKRDRHRCQLCGRKLNLKRQVPHPLAATVDHIIPLSVGGEHSYRNTQLVCFKCNSLKGNRKVVGGEQLRLFG